MKSLAELQAIKNNMADRVSVRTSSGSARIVVGMATCGIAAGARPVLNAFVEGISEAGLSGDVIVTQTGCIGVCRLEPIVEVFVPGQEKVTYVKMNAEKVPAIVAQHIVNKQVVTDYTIGAAE